MTKRHFCPSHERSITKTFPGVNALENALSPYPEARRDPRVGSENGAKVHLIKNIGPALNIPIRL